MQQAFDTAAYFINDLPSPLMLHKSPYELLFHSQLFRVKRFGCLCHPWLKPHTADKLSPRSAT